MSTPEVDPQPEADHASPLPDVGSYGAGAFLAAVDLHLDRVSGTEVSGYVEANQEHHTPWGVVHGGFLATLVETAASIGASEAVRPQGQFAVGVNNQTDFLRPHRRGRLDVHATPIQQGRNLQLWLVEITNTEGKLVARGQLRLSNQPLAAS